MPTDPIKQRLHTANWIAALGLLLGIGLTLAVGAAPMALAARKNDQHSEAYRAELAKLDGLRNTLSQVEGELERTRGRLLQAEARLPSSSAMDEFMVQLARVAENSGLQVEGITPQPLKDTGNYRAMPVVISGTGTFETCYAFLTGLRKMDRLTRLDNLVVQVEQSGDHDKPGGKPVCRVTVGISTFMAR